MEYRLIITKLVVGKIQRRERTFDRYHRTLLGAMREGKRLLDRSIAIKVEVFCPVANRIIERRLRGSAKWIAVEEEDHVPSPKDNSVVG